MPEGKSNYPAEVVRRRSERVLLDMPLVIRGEPEHKPTFREQTFTLTVSAHGALILLGTTVVLGQTVVLMNPKTWDERKGKITYLGSSHAGLAQVGIEFEQPAPDFWSIRSPPADWNLC